MAEKTATEPGWLNMGEAHPTNPTDDRRLSRRTLIKGAGAASLGAISMTQPAAATTQGQADPSENSLPLDEDPEQIETISRDGVTYEVYRRENALWYADGVEIYADGEKLTRRQEADEVLEIIAWQEALADLSARDLEAMKYILKNARAIQDLTGTIGAVLSDITGLFNWMKETSTVGISVWDAATSASPTIEVLEDAIREIQDLIGDWERAAGSVTSSLPDAVDGIERIQDGKDVDHSAVSSDIQAAADSLQELEPLTRDLADAFAEARAANNEVAADVAQVPGYGDDLASEFRSFGHQLQNVADDVSQFTDAIAGQASLLEQLADTATSRHDELLNQWGTRQEADVRVFGTLGGSGAVGVGGIGLAAWKFML